MFHGWLKSRFYSKCKEDVKLMKARIEMIKKKRNAMQKFLMNDVADLLRNGQDYNAYRRAEGLILEMNRSSCYDHIDSYCDVVSTQIASLDKQRECPEECREAVSTLMFAAAWFADLPELRQLRTLFSERFGKSLDFYVSKEFAEKVKSSLPSKDAKIRLLQKVAEEVDIEWDSKALENKLYNESIANIKSLVEEFDVGDSMDGGYQPRGEREVPIFKDIHVHIPTPTERVQRTNDAKEKEKNVNEPVTYKWIPPPYRKHEAKDKISCSTTSPQKGKPIEKLITTKEQKGRSDLATTSVSDEDNKERTNKENVAHGQRLIKFFNKGAIDGDEDEKDIDKLLDYYSRRGSEPGIDERNRNDGPKRTSSLPTDSITAPENSKKHTRSASHKLGMGDDDKPRAHSKPPDYDEFMARLTTLKKGMR